MMSKKGLMDDLFDFLFTVLFFIFIGFTLGWALNHSLDASHSRSLDRVAKFNQIDSALRNLESGAQTGLYLSEDKIEERIANSQVIGGRVITRCEDYFTPEDCTADSVELNQKSADSCYWDDAVHQCFLQAVMVYDS